MHYWKNLKSGATMCTHIHTCNQADVPRSVHACFMKVSTHLRGREGARGKDGEAKAPFSIAQKNTLSFFFLKKYTGRLIDCLSDRLIA